MSADLVYVAAPLIFSLAVCIYAFVKGGAPERLGATIILANMLAGVATESANVLRTQLVVLSIDGVTAMILLVLAVRYASLWLGAVMLLYALQFALHGYYFVMDRPRDVLHVVLNNADFLSVFLCLAVGTSVAWRRRAAQQAAADSGVAGAAS